MSEITLKSSDHCCVVCFASKVLPICGNGNSILMHDNAPPHTDNTAKTTNEYLEQGDLDDARKSPPSELI